MIHGVRGVHEIIAHLWNFNTDTKGRNDNEDNKKSLFAGSLSGIDRNRWNVIMYPEDGQVEGWSLRQVAEAFVRKHLQGKDKYLQGNDNACYDLINYVCQLKMPKDLDVVSF